MGATEAGVTENPLSELTMEEIEQKWASSSEGLATIGTKIASEIERQKVNDDLRKKFADQAESFSKYCDDQLAAVESIVNAGGEPQETLNKLEAEGAKLQEGDAKLAELRASDSDLTNAGVTDNKYTQLAFTGLEVKWSNFKNDLEDKKSILVKSMAEKSTGGVSADQLQEFRECFNHFDKDQSGTLGVDEFKACMNAIGDYLSDQEVTDLFAKYGGDKLPFDGFIEFMTKRVSDNDSEEDIVAAFQTLAGDQGYVTLSQLAPAFDPATLEYLKGVLPPFPGVPDAYDYKAWVAQTYQK